MMSPIPELNGLVLSGGYSTRMQRDKGSLAYLSLDPHREDQRSHCYRLLSPYCNSTFVSCREDQKKLIPSFLPTIFDTIEGGGPGLGILSAFKREPHRAWFIFACDFPFADEEAIRLLIHKRNPKKSATLFRNPETKLLEPLFAIWEPLALEYFHMKFTSGTHSPRKCLERLDCEIVIPSNPAVLVNVNTVDEWNSIQKPELCSGI